MRTTSEFAEPWSSAVDQRSNQPYLAPAPKRLSGVAVFEHRKHARQQRKERLAAAVTILTNPDKLRVWLHKERGLIDETTFRWELQREHFRLGHEIWKIACEYNGYIAVSRGAPRSSTIEKELHAVEMTCKAAARAIDALGDITLDLWHGIGPHGLLAKSDAKFQNLYDRALAVGFPQYAGFSYPDLDDPGDQCGDAYPGGRLVFLAPRLRMTGQLAALLRKHVRKRFGADKGGGRDLHQREHGLAAWHLVRLCYEPTATRTGDPTSTEGGTFYRFVAAVHEFATGEEGETLKGLRNRVKDGVAILGEQRRLMLKFPSWTAEESEHWHELVHALGHGRRPTWLAKRS